MIMKVWGARQLPFGYLAAVGPIVLSVPRDAKTHKQRPTELVKSRTNSISGPFRS